MPPGENSASTEKPSMFKSENLCVHCLGRSMGNIGRNLEHHERGALLREHSVIRPHLFVPGNVPEDIQPKTDCPVCKGLFADLSNLYTQIQEFLNTHEVNTFLIGIQLTDEIERADQKMQEQSGGETSEPIKSEIQRLLGLTIEDEYELEVDWETPDVLFLIDTETREVKPDVRPQYIYGQYNKYSRDLPQTIFHCRECRGRGCQACEQTGREYEQSVQEIIQGPLIDQSEAKDAKFHGAGREDINVRCLGKREFVVELVHPRKRRLDLQKARENINQSEHVNVYDLQETDKEQVKRIKQRRADKTYRALVKLSEPVDANRIEQLPELTGTIEQSTPYRVQHRRPKKVRRRDIHNLQVLDVKDDQVEISLTAEAGTYIKEFISGDNGRTEPSVSSFLDVDAVCETLDVTDIYKGN